MNKVYRSGWITVLLIMLLAPLRVYAGLIASGTRVIYTEGTREISLMLANTNSWPIIVQSWVDDGSGNPAYAGAPFIVLPSVFRLQPEGIQGLRIVYNQTPLPRDRESVFWINLYEIPPVSKNMPEQSRLQLAMNTQLKIFYRPQGLSPVPGSAVAGLKFRVLQEGGRWYVECDNPSPWHISFTDIIVRHGKTQRHVEREMDMMTAPFSQRRYTLSGKIPMTSASEIQFYYIDDRGAILNKNFILDTSIKLRN
ncbi:fimbrial biogenesis chaperone [Klebsiella quasivariicola]|uniref:fimbrial biogenesis chaperone n=1 Tax=Klebsiella quasivariicola TaxID=2026240 RepID=UPI002478706C|nr:molecular chaperone [Klebsiella quasivariicola]